MQTFVKPYFLHIMYDNYIIFASEMLIATSLEDSLKGVLSINTVILWIWLHYYIITRIGSLSVGHKLNLKSTHSEFRPYGFEKENTLIHVVVRKMDFWGNYLLINTEFYLIGPRTFHTAPV